MLSSSLFPFIFHEEFFRDITPRAAEVHKIGCFLVDCIWLSMHESACHDFIYVKSLPYQNKWLYRIRKHVLTSSILLHFTCHPHFSDVSSAKKTIRKLVLPCKSKFNVISPRNSSFTFFARLFFGGAALLVNNSIVRTWLSCSMNSKLDGTIRYMCTYSYVIIN